MSCDTHEIEIEQRAYGALAPELYAVLDEHLAGCADCRAFEGTRAAVAQSLTRHRAAEMEGIDMDQLRLRISSLRARHTRRLAAGLVVQAAWFGVLAWWMTTMNPTARHQWFPAACSLLFVGFMAKRAIDKRAAEAEAIVRAEGDLLAWWRTQLDGWIAGLGRSALLLPILAIAIAVVAWFLHEPSTARAYWVGATVWVFGDCILSIVILFQRRSRLAERASLG